MAEVSRIYSVVTSFNKSAWKSFARMKLKLTDFEIEECEDNNPGDIREQRYQMVRKWQQKNRKANTVVKLEELAGNLLDLPAGSQLPSTTSGSSNGVPYPGSSPACMVARPAGDISEQHQANSRNSERLENVAAAERGYPIEVDLRSAPGEASVSVPSDGQMKKDIVPVVDAELHSSQDVVVEDDKLTDYLKKALDSFMKPDQTHLDGNFCYEVAKVVVENTSPAKWKEMKNNDMYTVSKPKGCVLILNNSFKSDPDPRNVRHGSELDVDNMNKLWSQMGCKIHRNEPQQEKKASEMRDLLKEMTELEHQYSFIVIVIMSHGGKVNGEFVFRGVDHKNVKVDEIKEMFSNRNAKNLHNIPKFFILQFCRGVGLDEGVSFDGIDEAMRMIPATPTPPLNVVQADYAGLLPASSDILIAYATHEEYKAWRHSRYGSWFVNAVTNVFMRFSNTEDVESMLTKVHSAMKSMSAWYEEKISEHESRKFLIKAMSKHETSLTKKLFLCPGYHQ